MKLKTAFVILLWLAAAIAPSYAAAQAPAAGTFPPCIPAGQPAAPAGGGRGEGGTGQAQQRVPRDVAITAIPGVVAASAKWTKVWQGAGNSADGIVADRDGNMLIAQEDYDAVLKIDKNGKASVHISNAKGVGSLSMDRQGRLYGVHRTERPGSTKALFVTNGGTVVHFDVRGPGMLANRRDFATLETGNVAWQSMPRDGCM